MECHSIFPQQTPTASYSATMQQSQESQLLIMILTKLTRRTIDSHALAMLFVTQDRDVQVFVKVHGFQHLSKTCHEVRLLMSLPCTCMDHGGLT